MRALVVLAVLGACSAFPFVPAAPPKWTGPFAATVPAGLPGSGSVVAQTAEVAAARNEFYNTYNAQIAAVVPGSTGPVFKVVPAVVTGGWTGPVAATIPAGVPGSAANVADTADVMNAKNAFFNTYNAQVAAVAPAPKV